MTTPAQFRRVYTEGRSCRGRGLEIRVLRAPSGAAPRPARLGITIRRAVVRTSVRRNQWKRWIREAFRRHQAAWPPGCDIVVSVLHDEPGWQAGDVAQALKTAVTVP